MPDITSLSLVTGTEQTRQTFVKQLRKYISEDIPIENFELIKVLIK